MSSSEGTGREVGGLRVCGQPRISEHVPSFLQAPHFLTVRPGSTVGLGTLKGPGSLLVAGLTFRTDGLDLGQAVLTGPGRRRRRGRRYSTRVTAARLCVVSTPV